MHSLLSTFSVTVLFSVFNPMSSLITFIHRFPIAVLSNRLSFRLTLILLMSCLCYSTNTSAQDNYLPPEVQSILDKYSFTNDVYTYSIALLNPSDSPKGPQPFTAIGWRVDKPMHPASTIKLLTTISALDQLGPDYRFKTNLYLKGKIERGTLSGQLFIKGFGDPKLVPESLSQLVEQLKGLGVNSIDADIVLDNTAYQPSVKYSAPSDGELMKAYNVTPNPLLYAFQTISFTLNANKKNTQITYTPQLANFQINNRLSTAAGNCSDWRKNLRFSLKQSSEGRWEANFDGKLPGPCQNLLWNIAAIPHETFFRMGWIAAWENAGGKWLNQRPFQVGQVPPDAPLILQFAGTTLIDAVNDTNKFSNNVMSRQIFLAPALEQYQKPVSTEDAITLTKKWLTKQRLSSVDLVLENGSGLSDIERISARQMTDLLRYAAFSKHQDYFIASLPIAGIDGTMQNRLIAQVKNLVHHILHDQASSKTIALPEKLHTSGAYIKTGTLQQVRSVAGYVVSKTGRVYAVSSMLNHVNAGIGGSAVNDALMIWLLNDGPMKIGVKVKSGQNQ